MMDLKPCPFCGGEAEEYHKMAPEAFRAMQEAEKNEPPVRCEECIRWTPIDAMGGYAQGELERLGKCTFIRGVFMATDFCSRAKRHQPMKEENKNEKSREADH